MDAKALLWLYLVVALVVSIAASVADDDADDDDEGGEKAWKRFRERNGKKYRNKEEYVKRRGLFKTNAKKVKSHNDKYNKGESSFKMALNKFSDMTFTEFGDSILMRGGARQSDDSRPKGGSMYKAKRQRGGGRGKGRGGKKAKKNEKTVDWRESGCITRVKNQLSCGSCYAFAAAGAMEAYHCLKTGQHVLLSEQNLVDCTSLYGNKGCEWGYVHQCWMYAKAAGGISTQRAYPYVNEVMTCRHHREEDDVSVKDFVNVPRDESVIAEVVKTVGPVAVTVHVSPDMQFYELGILDDPGCTREDYMHAMLVVGLGSDESRDYWIVKNSWGGDWGDGGYLKMSRNKRNQCDIAGYAMYPVL